MALTLAEIKDLIAYGHELGLQHMQVEGVSVVYGQRAVMPAHPSSAPDSTDDTAGILAHYSAIGREKLMGHSSR